MGSDYDKRQWQAEQAQRDAALEKQRDKERKTRERAARNAQRKLARLHRTLSDAGDITEFEDEFGQSVLERLDKFGSAFHDLEKGRPGDALSFAQRSVVSAMNKKVKSLKKQSRDTNPDGSGTADGDSDNNSGDNFEDGYVRTADRWKNQNIADKPSGKSKRSSFGSKKAPKYTPNVRHIEDDFAPEPPKVSAKVSYDALAPDLKNRVPYLPQYISGANSSKTNNKPSQSKSSQADMAEPDVPSPNPCPSSPKKPFLRLVK